MANTAFQLKRSSVSGKLPKGEDLQVGELAVNLSDGLLFTKRSDNTVIVVSGTKGDKGDIGLTGDKGIQGDQGDKGDKGNTGTLDAYTYITSNHTATARSTLLADTTSGSFTVTLPASPSSGDWVRINDGGNWTTNNLTIARNGNTIEGTADDLIVDIGNIVIELTYNGSTWLVTSNAGTKGDTGDKGDTGTTGDKGDKGDTGSKGNTGDKGDTGSKGEKGETGVTGDKGDTGSKGDKGEIGSTGAKGDTGATGSKGDKGDTGTTGSKGDKGDTGAKGDTGSRAFSVTNSGASAYTIDGSNNPTLNLLRGFTYSFSLNASGHPFWIKTSATTGTGNQYNSGVTNNGTASGTIIFSVPFDAPSTLYYICQFHGSMQGTINISDVGPTGSKGDKGDKGDTGSKGDTGTTGSAGSKGDKGDTGQKGDTGAKGDTGSKGDKGDSGSKGDKGDTGLTGLTGNKGDTGATGSSGSKGDKGDEGTAGSKGDKGDVGAKGDAGSFGGQSFDFTYTNLTSNTEPGDGYFRFDNTALNSATKLYIDQQDGSSANIYSFLQTIDDSTSAIKGHFSVTDSSNNNNFAIFSIVGSHSHYTHYFEVPVSYLSGNTGFSNNTVTVITFARTGDIGDKGVKGDTGQKGDNGTKGDVGEKGDKGNVGNTGTSGSKGDKGDTGATGDKGNTGSTGDKGDVGSTGAKGDKGDTGSAGTAGSKGDKGDIGVKGEPGTASAKGEKGDTGTAGNKGDKGNDGSTGTTGDKGEKGDTGITGDKGDTGSKGDTGTNGDKGDKGETGVTGDKGDTGATGDKGDTGAKGNTGDKGDTGLTGAKGDKGDVEAQGNKGEKGDIGVKGEPGTASAKGEKGDTGTKGDKGIDGVIGVNGDKGDKGEPGTASAKGDKGDTGSAGTFDVTFDTFTGNGSQTVFTLSTAPVDENHTIINIQGISQLKTSYTISGSNVVFSSAPANNDVIDVTTLVGGAKGQKGDDGFFGVTLSTFTGNGSATSFTLSSTPPSEEYTIVNIQGILQLKSSYTVSGNTITFDSAPANNDLIDVMVVEGGAKGDKGITGDKGTKGSKGDTTSFTYLNRTYTGNGSATAYTVTTGMSNVSVLVTENGVMQEPEVDYTVAGTTLTFTTAPANGVKIMIRELPV